MPACRPQSEDDQRNHRAHALMAQHARGGASMTVGIELFGGEDAQRRTNPFLGFGQQIEKPQAAGDPGVDKIGQTHHQVVEPDVQDNRVVPQS